MVIILSDQTFPTVRPLPQHVPTKCTIIIRVEDCELRELEDVFNDRLKIFGKPHCSLSSGSVILPLVVGSMSHLAKNGLNFYAPSWSKQ